jgi:6-phosphogluconolactonase
MRVRARAVFVFLAACVALSLAWLAPPVSSQQTSARNYWVYVGTYTRNTSEGIYGFRFDASTGELRSLGLMAETPSPSFIAAHPNGHFLYAANEREYNEVMGNRVTTFAIEPGTGRLTQLQRTSSQGDGPAHVLVDPTGRALIVSNYRGGSVAVLPIQTDGTLGNATSVDQHYGRGPHPTRQDSPHAHGSVVSPDNRWVLTADHGIDQVMAYRLDAGRGTLAPANPPSLKVAPGRAPRHVAFHPNGRTAYVVNELIPSLTVLGVSEGVLRELQTVATMPGDYSGQHTGAEVVVNRAGTVVYTSNRGPDTITVFAIDQSSGLATAVQYMPTGGMTPRNIALDPTGQLLFVGNQASNNLVLFRVDEANGHLTPTGQVFDVPEPTAITFVPAP